MYSIQKSTCKIQKIWYTVCMTKFILHGGATSTRSEKNSRFFREIVKGFDKRVKILLVYFSRDKFEWDILQKKDKETFQSVFNGKILFDIASEDYSEFKKQVMSNDIVYLRGGKTPDLQKKLQKMKNFKKIIHGKVVVGSSAGAYVLSEYYYSNRLDSIFEGLGVLPIKVFCHFDESKQNALQKLKNFGQELETIILPEEEFIVIES